MFPLCCYYNEFDSLYNPDIMNRNFIVMNVIAGVLGFYLNFASLWCVAETSASTYAIVGSLSKIPVTILGVILFHVPISPRGASFIAMAILGGLIYGYAKLPSHKK